MVIAVRTNRNRPGIPDVMMSDDDIDYFSKTLRLLGDTLKTILKTHLHCIPREPTVLCGRRPHGPDALHLVERKGLVDVPAGVDVSALRPLL